MRSFFTSRLFISFFIVLFLILAFIAFLPSIVSSNWGKSQITQFINEKIPGKVEIKDLEIHWDGGQVVEGFVLKDQNDTVVLEFEKLFLEANLFQLINRSTHLGEVRLQDLNASIIIDEKGISNLQHALGVAQESYYGSLPNGNIDISNLNAKINFYSKKQPLSIHISGLTHQNRLNGSIELHAILPGLEFEDWSQINDEAKKFFSVNGSKEAALEAKIQQFPVDILDQFLSLKKPELRGIFRQALGEKININLDKESSSEGLAFNLTLLSPRLQGNVKGKMLNDKFLIQEPSTFHFDLSPELINPIQNEFQLTKRTRFKLILDEFSCPISFSDNGATIDPCDLAVKMQATSLENQTIVIRNLGNVGVDALKINVDSAQCSEKINVTITGNGSYEKEQFNINSSYTLTKPKEFPINLNKILSQSEATINLGHFPLSFLNVLKNDNLELVKEIAGPYANIHVKAKNIQEGLYDLSLSFESDKISIKNLQFQIDREMIKLAQPTKISSFIDPKSINPFLKSKLYLKNSIESELTISNIKLQLSSKSPSGEIQAQLKINPLKFVSENNDELEIVNIQASLNSKSLKEFASKISFNFKVNKTESFPYLALIGDKGNFSLSGNFKMTKENKLSFENIKTYIESNKASLSFDAEILPEAHFILTSPLQLHYKLDSQAFDILTNHSASPKLTNNPLIYLSAEPFQINLKDLRLDTFTIKGNISSDKTILQNKFGSLTKIENVSIPWEINVPLNMIRVNFKALTSTDLYPIKPSEITTQLLIFNIFKDGKFDFNNSKIEATSNLIGLPTSLVSSLTLKEDLTPLFGPILDVELKTSIDPNTNQPGFCNVVVDSAYLHLSARLTFDKFLTLTDPNKPAEFRWTLTPEGYDYLQKLQNKEEGEALDSSITLRGTISDISFPLSKEKSFLEGGKFKCFFETTNIIWEEIKVPPIKFNGQIQTSNSAKEIIFETKGIIDATSNLNIKGKLSNLSEIEKKGFQGIDIAFNLIGERFPVEFFQRPYLPDNETSKKLATLFGKKIDFSLSADFRSMEGPIKGIMKGSEGELLLDGQLKKGVLYLNAPFEWTFKLSADFGRTFFKEGVLNSVLGSSHPIKLSIQPKGFAVPIYPFDKGNIQVGKGTLTLNKVLFKNEGEIKKVISLIQSISDDKVSIWFTPIYFQIENGDLKIQRVDMLLTETYEMALWGNVDLTNTKINMKLGLNNKTLADAFNIPHLASNYMLVVPIKGKNGKIEVDKKQVLASIASLVAQAHGSSEGKILSGILELSTALTNNEQIPEPTTSPLPWKQNEKMIQDNAPNQNKREESSHSKKSKSKKDSSDNFIKELEKGASTVLDLLNPVFN